jgi:hypothetical protein
MLQGHEMLRGEAAPDAPPTSKTDVHNHDSGREGEAAQDRKTGKAKSDSKEHQETCTQQPRARENVPHDGRPLHLARQDGRESPRHEADCDGAEKGEDAHGATHSIRRGPLAVREFQNGPKQETKKDGEGLDDNLWSGVDTNNCVFVGRYDVGKFSRIRTIRHDVLMYILKKSIAA